MADMHGVFQIEVRGERGHISGVGIHLVARRRLGGAAVTAAIMGDDPITLRQKK
jgi:hypothetical protein